ncbi:MAG TPA: type II secretion system F family protein, partial [Symbiobacteriaceae bacterium]|nr:type II secretion system F family protein [Symbiobacteriaceae bacterium]
IPAHWLAAMLPRRYTAMLRLTLMRARLADSWPLHEFLALKLISSLFFAGLVFVLYHEARTPVVLYAGFMPIAAGWILPDFWLKRRAAARQAAVQRDLPHLLSSLAICLQTGLSLQTAVLELGTVHRTGVLGEELRMAGNHLHAGATPAEALTAMTERCGIVEMTQAIGTIVQHAERTPSAASAAAVAEARRAWDRKRRRAEAIAQSASLKLFLPQLLLGLPALLLVLMGPAVLVFMDIFKSLQ